jgi:3-hydroxyisobutyrate dehydrogenase-like beta-hydroxyacid dehydrogenase
VPEADDAAGSRHSWSEMMHIAFIGTGTMGTPIAGCLISAGHQLVIHDIRREATRALAAQGVAVAETPREAAQGCEVAFTSLPGPTEIEAAVLDTEAGLLAGLPAGGAYIDLTTNAPGIVRVLHEACREQGVGFLDAPVSGRPPNMTAMVGGAAADFARCRPLFDAIAKNVFHVGPSGAGCAAKLVTQYLGYTNFIAALEGMLVAAKAGIDLAMLAQIVPVSAGQSRTFDNIPRSVLTRAFTSGGTLDIVAKDMDLAVALAHEVGAPGVLGALASDVYKRAQAQGWGQEGFPIVARILEAMAGVELKAEPPQ